jgi:60 kDa SS-A/Ro ribonucleoprotein
VNYLLEQATEKKTPQSQPIPGKKMERNNAGGFVFKVDSWTQLERFLILGSPGGTYYVGERELTKENVDNVRACIETDGLRTVQMIRDISLAGRAPKNDPALYALALAASTKDQKTVDAALAALPAVARIGTHLFTFAAFVDTMRGWGPALRRAVGAWYLEKQPDKLAYQLVKYQQRNGWAHRDLLRLAHPKASASLGNPSSSLLRWAVKGAEPDKPVASTLIDAFESAKKADEKTLIGLIREHGLTREMIPTEHQKSPAVWGALLDKMPIGAMIRTLGRMGSVGLLKPLSDASANVVSQLSNRESLRKARVHPIQVLSALLTYQQGHGQRGSLTWTPVPQVVDALNDAFYAAFEFVPPTGKRFYLGVDVSGSMSSGLISGVPGLTPRMGAAAMTMLAARTEPNYYAAGFSDGSRVKGAVRGQTMHSFAGSRYAPSMEQLPISKAQRLDSVMKLMENVPMGGTDCSLPMLDALHNKLSVDCFIVYTDNETWAGSIHPKQALDQYRQKMGIDAKLVVCGMTATDFSIADPSDAGMIDIVGFDTSVPTLISGFLGGKVEGSTEYSE